MAEQNINVAQQDTLESVSSKIDTLDTVADNIYSKVDTEVAAIKTQTDLLTSTRAGYIDRIANSTYGLDKIKTLIDTIKTVIDTINTNVSNLNNRLTSTRAGYLDYLANGTYGLNAIKTAINNVNTAVNNLANSGDGYAVYGSSKTIYTLPGAVNTSTTGYADICTITIPYNGHYKLDWTGALRPYLSFGTGNNTALRMKLGIYVEGIESQTINGTVGITGGMSPSAGSSYNSNGSNITTCFFQKGQRVIIKAAGDQYCYATVYTLTLKCDKVSQ